MDAREEQAREILKEWNINPDQYWPKEAFSSEKQDDQTRAANLVDRVKKASEFAGTVVEHALNNGTRIVFSQELSHTDGFYTQKGQDSLAPYDKKIVLNAHLSDERLMSTVVRLARQAEQRTDLSPQMTMHGAVTTARAKAADAKAVEAAAAFEMRFSEPKAYQAFFENNMLIAGCYYYAMQEKNDMSHALSYAAKTWYDRPAKQMEAFDNSVINAMCSAGMGDGNAFAFDVSASSLRDIFSYAGTSYMDKAFLSGVKANGIGETLAAKIERIEKYHKKEFKGKDPQKTRTSADRFHVVRKDGTVRFAQNNLSVMNRLSACFGRS